MNPRQSTKIAALMGLSAALGVRLPALKHVNLVERHQGQRERDRRVRQMLAKRPPTNKEPNV